MGDSAPQLLRKVSGRSQLLGGHCREGLGFWLQAVLSCLPHGLSPKQHPAKQLAASEEGKRPARESKGDGSPSSIALRQELTI